MSSDGSVTHWIDEIKGGNRDAAQGLWERYFARLVRLARLQISEKNRRVSDEEDVALSVFETFCRAAEDGRFPNLSDRDSLWRLLVRMTAPRPSTRTAAIDDCGGAEAKCEANPCLPTILPETNNKRWPMSLATNRHPVSQPS